MTVVDASHSDQSAAPNLPDPRPSTGKKWPDVLAVALAVLIFSGLSVWMGYVSQSDLEADATTHFMMARYAARAHQYFASVWGRPLCTGTYFLAAQIGTIEQARFAARLTSLALALLIAAVTYLIAKRQDIRRPALVVILILAQPIFFLHSFSELTEIPFTVPLVLAFLAYQRRQWFAMALLTGLLPLGRPEGFGFILLAAIALIAHKRARWLWVLAIPFIAWNFAGFYWSNPKIPAGAGPMWWIFNRHWPMWVISQWPYSYQSVYGHGNLFSFTARLPVLVGPFVFPFTLIGLTLGIALIFKSIRRGTNWLRSLIQISHPMRCEILIVLIPLSILVVHSLLWWLGKMGSDGELRYLVIVGPFFALAGARGWEWVWARYNWPAPLLFAGIAAALPIAGNFIYPVVPLPIYAEGIVSRQMARWYQSNPRIQADYPRIMPTPPTVPFYLDLPDQSRFVSADKQSVALAPPGTLLVWDPIYGQNNASADMTFTESDIRAAGWMYFTTFVDGETYCSVYFSPKTIAGQPTVLPDDPDFSLKLFTVPNQPRVARR